MGDSTLAHTIIFGHILGNFDSAIKSRIYLASAISDVAIRLFSTSQACHHFQGVPNASVLFPMVFFTNLRVENIVSTIFTFCLPHVVLNAENLLSAELSKQ